MEIWLDTVNEEVITEAFNAGLLCGITTNPHILAKSPLSKLKTLERLLALQPGPVTVQVEAASAPEMIQEGVEFSKLSSRLIIKVPVTSEGYKTIKRLKDLNIPTMATVIFQSHEAVFASIAGADYLAPYFSRMRSEGIDAVSEIRHMCNFTKGQGGKSKVLIASLKEPEDFKVALEVNASAVTLKEDLFLKLFNTSSYTSNALASFKNVFYPAASSRCS